MDGLRRTQKRLEHRLKTDDDDENDAEELGRRMFTENTALPAGELIS